MQKLKRIVIKEEFVTLTGNYIEAIILNQFLFWTERVDDFDKFILEEKKRAENEGIEINMPLCNGWIYKTAEELSEETMLNLSPKTIRGYLRNLIEKGYLEERNNPLYKWDKTLQYRVNLIKIIKDLFTLGYNLEGYKFSDIIEAIEAEKTKNREEEMKNQTEDLKNQKVENEDAIPEITTEITNRNNNNSDVNVVVDKKFQEITGRSNIPFIRKIMEKYDIKLIEQQLDYLKEFSKNHKIDNPEGFITDGLKMQYRYPLGIKKSNINLENTKKMLDELRKINPNHEVAKFYISKILGGLKNENILCRHSEI